MQGSKMNSKLEKQFSDSWYLKTQEFRHGLIKRLGKHILFLCSRCWFHSQIGLLQWQESCVSCSYILVLQLYGKSKGLCVSITSKNLILPLALIGALLISESVFVIRLNAVFYTCFTCPTGMAGTAKVNMCLIYFFKESVWGVPIGKTGEQRER